MSVIINGANNINPASIKQLNPDNITNGNNSGNGSGQNDSFSNTLMGYIDKVNGTEVKADKEAEAIATGKSSNIHQAMIDMEKANDSFELMMQVRNKIVTAYNQIVNMQL